MVRADMNKEWQKRKEGLSMDWPTAHRTTQFLGTKLESWSPVTHLNPVFAMNLKKALLLDKCSSLKYVQICKLEVANKIFKDLAIYWSNV